MMRNFAIEKNRNKVGPDGAQRVYHIHSDNSEQLYTLVYSVTGKVEGDISLKAILSL